MKEYNLFSIQHFKAVIVPNRPQAEIEENEIQKRLVASLLGNLHTLGFSLDAPVVEHLIMCDVQDICNFSQDVIAACKDAVGDSVQYNPIWPNFPFDIADATTAEALIINFLHFVSHGAIHLEKDGKGEKPLLDVSKDTVLAGLSEQDFARKIVDLFAMPVPMAREDVAFAREHIFKTKLFEEALAITEKDAVQIQQRETLALLLAGCFESFGFKHAAGEKNVYDFLAKQIKLPKDVLRVAAVMSGEDASLSSPPKFKNFTRSERRFLMMLFTNTCSAHSAENMVRERELWKRFGEKVHPGEFGKAHMELFGRIRSREIIRTFEGRFDIAVRDKEYLNAANMAAERPGFLARNLDMLLRNAREDKEATDGILHTFASVAGKIESRVLVQLYNHMSSRDMASISVGRSDSSAVHVDKEKEVKPIDEDVINQVCDICEKSIVANLCSAQGDAPQKIYLDEYVSGVCIGTSMRNTAASMRMVAMGSSFPLFESAVEETYLGNVRAFLFWDNPEDYKYGNRDDDFWSYGGTDLDLSATFMDKDFAVVDVVNYARPRGEVVDGEPSGVHSGDVRFCTKEDGACEFVDISLSRMKERGVRYVAFTVISYSGQKFKTMKDCFVGWMRRDAETGSAFEPRTVVDKFSIGGMSLENLSFILDVEEQRAFIVNAPVKAQRFTSAIGHAEPISILSEAVVSNKGLTLKELVAAYAAASGSEMVSTPNDATLIFSDSYKLPEPTEGAENDGEKEPVLVNPLDPIALSTFALGE